MKNSRTGQSIIRLIIGVGILLLAGAVTSRAADGTWTNTAGGNWSTTANWTNGIVADGSGSTAFFNVLDPTADIAVALDTTRTIGNLVFSDVDTNTAAGWTLFGGPLTLAGASPTITVSNLAFGKTATISAVLTGQGFLKQGDAGLVLSGANTMVGPNELDAGTVFYGNATAFGGNSNTLAFNGGAIQFLSGAPSLGLTNMNVLTSATIIVTNGNYDSYMANGGRISGDANSVIYIYSFNRFTPGGTGGAAWDLFKGFSGTIDLTGSSSAMVARMNLGSTNIYDLSTVTLNSGTNGGRFQWRTTTSGTVVRIGALTGAGGRLLASEQAGNPLLTWLIGYKNLSTVYGGIIADTDASRRGALTKVGTGTLTLTSTNTYTGATVISNGVLALTGSALLSATPSITVVSPGIFDVSGMTAGTWSIATNAIISRTLAGNGTVAGSVTMTNGIISPGANVGTLTFANDLLLGGTATNVFDIVSPAVSDRIVVNGNLNLSSPVVCQLVPNLSNVIITNGTYVLFQYGTLTGDWSNNIVLSSPSQLGTFAINTNASSQIVLTVSGAQLIDLTWRGDHGSDWSTANNWRDTNGAPVTWSDGRVAHFDDTATTKSVTLSVPLSPARVLFNNTTAYDFTGAGYITGLGVMVKDGSGNVVMAVANNYSGSTTISNGTLQVGNGGSAGSIGSGPLIDNGIIAFNQPINITYGASISGTGGLIQMGPGLLTLNAINSYTGNTIISNDATLFVGDGAINGSVLGAVTVNSNATIHYLFNSAGSVFIDNGLIGTGNAIYEINEGGTTTSPRTITLTTLATNTGFSGNVDIKAGTRLEVTTAYGLPGTNITVELTPDPYFSGSLYVHGGAVTNTAAISIIGRGPATGVDTPRGFGTLRLNNGWAGLITIAGVDPLSGYTTIGGSSGTGTLLGNIADGGNGYPLEYFGGTIQVGPATGVNSYGATLISEALTGSGVGVSGNTTVVALNTNAFSTNALHMQGQSTLQLNGNNLAFANLIDDSASLAATNLYAPVILNNSTSAPATITVGRDNNDSTFNGKFGNGTSSSSKPLNFTKTGVGTLTLSGDSTNTGTVRVSGGTLSLAQVSGTYLSVWQNGPLFGGSGSFSNAALITVDSGGFLNVVGRTDGTLTLNSGQTLGGNGVVLGNVIALAGSTINPGSSIGTLALGNNLTLQGQLLLELNRTNGQKNDLLTVSGAASYSGGTLAVTNIGPVLQVGDSFTLFGGARTFGSFNLQTNDYVNNVKYTWNNTVASDGKITVTGVNPLVNLLSPAIQLSRAGNTLNLAWPTNLGWTLLTNSVGLKATDQWFPYPGSTLLTNVSINLDSTKSNVFYRMAYPYP